MQRSGEFTPEEAVRLNGLTPRLRPKAEAFVAEVKHLWPGAELVDVKGPNVLDRP